MAYFVSLQILPTIPTLLPTISRTFCPAMSSDSNDYRCNSLRTSLITHALTEFMRHFQTSCTIFKSPSHTYLDSASSISWHLVSESATWTEKANNYCVGVAPGRVNLIGEHTDYNEGFVCPFAIEQNCVVLGKCYGNERRKWTFISVSQEGSQKAEAMAMTMTNDDISTFESDEELLALPPVGQHRWHDILRGVIAQYAALGYRIPSFDAIVIGNVPIGGGLASSAALAVSTAMFLEEILDLKTDLKIIAKHAQEAENQYARVPCGIMDQMASCLGCDGHIMLLDCRTLETNFATLNDESVRLIVVNSNVKHSLANSEYARRRQQCNAAVSAVQTIFPKVKNLRDVDLDQLEHARGLMDERAFFRARHVITENDRANRVFSLLPQKQFKLIGMLMTQSHVSLKNDFEVSCDEVDTLVNTMLSQKGVFGSRMTGGGFGGCTVSLVQAEKAETIIRNVIEEYKHLTGKDAVAFVTRPHTGAAHFRIQANEI